MEDTSALIQKRKDECLAYVTNFYRRSWDWRSQKLHSKWDKCDRNYHSIYDPANAAAKEPWQSKMFLGITVQNVEIITSQIHKTMMAPKPPIQTVAGPAGDELQARLISEILEYEMRKGSYEVAFYDAVKEAVRYGSGFIKLFWERVEDVRRRREPVRQSAEQVVDQAPPEALTGTVPMPTPQLQGFQYQKKRVLLKNQLAAKWVHIRDIFPEPNTMTWDKVIHRDKISYGTICQHIKSGAFFDVKDKLQDVTEGEKFEQEVQVIKQELGYFYSNRDLTKFEKKHTIWELWAPIPRKWIQFDIPEGDEAEELVPGKVMVASGVALLASEENEKFDAEPPIVKLDYIRTGDTYGKGVPELIFDDQDEINELRNQRVDNINLILNKGLIVLETALVDAEADLVSKPGWAIRLKGDVDDVRKAVGELQFSDVTQSAYRETAEIERGVMERIGASRVTLGTSGEVGDTNQTLGGMELLRQMFNERVAAYGMVMEATSLMKCADKMYGLIYQELTPDELKPILGDDMVQVGEIPDLMHPGLMKPFEVPRYLAFAFVPPEEVNRSYNFKPMGIFSLENKIVKSAQVMDLIKLNLNNPSFDVNKASQYAAITLQGISEAEKWFRPIPMIPMTAIPPELLPIIMQNLQGGPGAKETPGMKGGPNGNGASFAPPNPVRREPVVQ